MRKIRVMLNSYKSKLKSLAQLPALVINNWHRHYNLRKVQSRAGHKYVSASDKYKKYYMADLKKELEKYYPV